jgi:ATP phosphoribosyltransferase regulatory subunit
VAPLGCADGLDRLAETLSILEERGVAQYVRVDFSIMNSLDYYTGIVMQAYAAGTPRPLGSGGRYDKLLSAFGKDEPAAGFAFGLETLTVALAAQGDEETPALPPLRIAVPKGALNPGSLAVLEAAGMDVACLRDPGRQMTFESTWGDVAVRYIIVRPTDAPVFVANGGADVGIAGEDSIVEADLDVNELCDLAFGGCKFVVAEAAERAGAADDAYRRRGVLRIATKYPNVTRAYYDRIGVQVDIIKLHGNIELAPRTGMADRIVDITATGTSLRENNLVVVDDVLPSTARFIASPSAAHVDPRVRALAKALEAAVSAQAAESEGK